MPEQDSSIKTNPRRRNNRTPQRAVWARESTTASLALESYISSEVHVRSRFLSSADWNTWSEGAKGGVIAGAAMVFVFLVAIIIYTCFQRQKADCPPRSRKGGDVARRGCQRPQSTRGNGSRDAEERQSGSREENKKKGKGKPKRGSNSNIEALHLAERGGCWE